MVYTLEYYVYIVENKEAIKSSKKWLIKKMSNWGQFDGFGV